jgi:hypothetical protein
MNKSLLVVLLAAAPAVETWAGRTEALQVYDGFLPPNNLRIPIGDVNALGIDEAAFDAVLTRVESLYAPIFAAKGKKLRVNRKWPDDTVNAGAMQFNNTWVINMYGGLARHKAVTAEGFALVACHEIGHHIGGYPKTDAVWPTNEGGSDYFATLKCLRRVFTGNEDTSKLDPVAVKACRAAHAAESERKLCEAGAMAGMSIAALFKDLRGQTTPPSFSTPDPTIVAKTNDLHPDTQCRLDSYFAGALCSKPLSEEQVDGTPITGACTATQGFTVGLRPKCWYKAPVGQAGPARPNNLMFEKDMDDILNDIARSLTEQGL